MMHHVPDADNRSQYTSLYYETAVKCLLLVETPFYSIVYVQLALVNVLSWTPDDCIALDSLNW